MAYSQQVFTYTPYSVFVVLGGYTVSGLVKVELTKTEPTFKVIRGIRGQNTRVKDLDESYTLTLELQQTDPVNDFLMDMHLEDKKSGGGSFVAIVADGFGNSRFYADNAFVESTPDIKFSKEFDNRTWVIKTLSNSGVFLGGNDLSSKSVNRSEITRLINQR